MHITIKNLTKRYGKKVALNNISLSLDNGVYALLGPNGSGKTTLMHILVGLLSHNSGEISIDDFEYCSNEYFQNLGYLPQYPVFYDNFNVYQYLEYICVLKEVDKNKRKEWICDVLEMTNLTEVSKSIIKSLSGGTKQRLGIAQAIINKPKLLLFDEPTAGLDPEERIRFRKIFSKISEVSIVIFATHIVSDLEVIADSLIFLKEGNIICFETQTDVLNKISAKVWEGEIEEQEINQLNDYNVINMTKKGKRYRVRLIADTQPLNKLMQVEASLEDAYFYYFGVKYANSN